MNKADLDALTLEELYGQPIKVTMLLQVALRWARIKELLTCQERKELHNMMVSITSSDFQHCLCKELKPGKKVKYQDKICLECKHLYYSPGEYDLSDMTPGYDATMRCTKGHWEVDFYSNVKRELRDKLRRAMTCPDFVLDENLYQVRIDKENNYESQSHQSK